MLGNDDMGLSNQFWLFSQLFCDGVMSRIKFAWFDSLLGTLKYLNH